MCRTEKNVTLYKLLTFTAINAFSSCLELLVEPESLPMLINLTRLFVLEAVGALPVEVATFGARHEVIIVAGVARGPRNAAGRVRWRCGEWSCLGDRGIASPGLRGHCHVAFDLSGVHTRLDGETLPCAVKKPTPTVHLIPFK